MFVPDFSIFTRQKTGWTGAILNRFLKFVVQMMP